MKASQLMRKRYTEEEKLEIIKHENEYEHKSYWNVLYQNGEIYKESEMDSRLKVLGLYPKISGWDLISKKDIFILYLFLPRKRIVSLPKRKENYQFFQFKIAEKTTSKIRTISLMRNECILEGDSIVLRHIIGAVIDDKGESIAIIYDYPTDQTVVTLTNVHDVDIGRPPIGHINFSMHEIDLPAGDCHICNNK